MTKKGNKSYRLSTIYGQNAKRMLDPFDKDRGALYNETVTVPSLN